MVLFEVIGKRGTYPNIVLDGRKFYLKAQEMIFGSNNFKSYETIKENIEDLEIKVIDIDLDKNNINKSLAELYQKESSVGYFVPVNKHTIEKHYQKMYDNQNFDFYQNLCHTYSEEKLKEIVEFAIYRNVSPNWIAVYFEMDIDEVLFILEHLPLYYNFIER